MRAVALAVLAVAVATAVAAATGWWLKKEGRGVSGDGGERREQVPLPVTPPEDLSDDYDVIVAGTDPEGVAAAVSAARNGLKTLLVDGRDRDVLGGLFTLGWLNSLDMNYVGGRTPGRRDYWNKGIFKEWFEQVEGTSFDVKTAADVFARMVRAERNVDLLMKVRSMRPVVETASGGRTVRGLAVTMPDGSERTFRAFALIDATQDADVAAAAGAKFTVGREDLGDPGAKMAATLVFQLKGVTPEVWRKIKKSLNADDDPNSGADDRSAWGYKGMYEYVSLHPDRLRMRGLNIGLQNDHTALVNAVLLFGVDPFDAASVREAFNLVRVELPRIVAEMKRRYPEFAGVEPGETARELYVRESRHLVAEYRLSIVDLLENRDQWDRVAIGSYPVDLQRTSPDDPGAVLFRPERYAVPFRSLVPKGIDGLLVVGRSAGFDSLAHGSARVVPLGMATGQAAGAAVKVAKEAGLTIHGLAQSRAAIAELQNLLNQQGMEIHPFQAKTPEYMRHRTYPGLKAAVSLGLAKGGYDNRFRLDDPANPQGFVWLMAHAKRMFPAAFPGDPSAALAAPGFPRDVEPETAPLTLDQAAYTVLCAANVRADRADAGETLIARGWLKPDTVRAIADVRRLTLGETYLLLRDAVEGAAGRRFD